jgi:hypothetical protein
MAADEACRTNKKDKKLLVSVKNWMWVTAVASATCVSKARIAETGCHCGHHTATVDAACKATEWQTIAVPTPEVNSLRTGKPWQSITITNFEGEDRPRHGSNTVCFMLSQMQRDAAQGLKWDAQ